MHIIVCIKQTPKTSKVEIDPKTGLMNREGMEAGINPFDEYAVEEAVRLKERVPGSTVSVLTMGPPQAEKALREAIERGCDDAYLVSSKAFRGADTWATSYTLQMAIRKISEVKSPFNIIVCGKQTNDGDTGHVGPGIASWLNIPNAAYVGKVEDIKPDTMRIRRMMEDGYDVLDLQLPCLISVVKEINEPRVPSLKGKMAAKKAVVTIWDEAAIGADKTKIGLPGSPTIVAKSFNPPPRKGGKKSTARRRKEKAKKLVAKLRELKLISTVLTSPPMKIGAQSNGLDTGFRRYDGKRV